jgi:hypothetical protein
MIGVELGGLDQRFFGTPLGNKKPKMCACASIDQPRLYPFTLAGVLVAPGKQFSADSVRHATTPAFARSAQWCRLASMKSVN